MPKAKVKEVSQKKVAQDFDKFVESYDEQINSAISFSGLKVDFFVKAKCEYLTRITKKHFGNNEALKVLDFGCGVAGYHDELAPNFDALHGIDVSPRSVEYAKKYNNKRVEYAVYPGGILPYEDNSFDVAFAICVMHHVPTDDWGQAFSELHRVIKPGGLVIIFEHNPRNPVTWRIVNNCPIDEDAVLLKPKIIKDFLRTAGMGKLKSRSILSIPPIWNILYPVDHGLGVLTLDAQYYALGTKKIRRLKPKCCRELAPCFL